MKIQPIFYFINKFTPRTNQTPQQYRFKPVCDTFELSFKGGDDKNSDFRKECENDIEEFDIFSQLTDENKQELLNVYLENPDYSSFERQYLFDIGMQGGKFNINQVNENLELQEIAKLHRHSLKDAEDTFNDNAIKQTFLVLGREIVDTTKLIGKDNFTYLFKSPMSDVKDYISTCSAFKNPCSLRYLEPETYEKLIQLTNPKESEYYKSLQNQIDFKKKRLNDYKGENVVHFEKYAHQKIKELTQEIKTKDKTTDKEEIKALYQQIKDLKHDVNKTKTPFVIKKEKEISGLKQKMKTLEQKRIKDPQEVAQVIRMIEKSNGDGNLLLSILKLEDNVKKAALTRYVGNNILKNLKMPNRKDILEALDIENSQYNPELITEDRHFYRDLSDLFSVVDLTKNETVLEQLNKLPQNLNTRKQFEELGINYDKWTQFDPKSNVKLQLSTNINQAKQDAVSNFTKCFTNDNFQSDMPGICKKLLMEELKSKLGMEFKGNGFYKNGKPLEFDDLEAAIKLIKRQINLNEIWSNGKSGYFEEIAKNRFEKNIFDHCASEVKVLKNFDLHKVHNIEIRKADMNNLAHSLFLGNHSACCTAIGSLNSPMAISYIKNKMAAAIEILDGKTAVGNTMCFIALIDGKPALYLDNIEILPKYQYNDEIRDAIFKYAHQLCKEVGKPNMPVYANTRCHKIKMPKAEDWTGHNIQLIGSTGQDKIYIDAKIENMRINGSDYNSFKHSLFLIPDCYN